MKFDKPTIVVIALCVVFLIAWDPFCRKMGWLPEKTPTTAQKTAPAAAPAAPGPVAPKQPAAPVNQPLPETPAVLPAGASTVVLENDQLAVKFESAPGAIEAVTLKKFLNHQRSGEIVIDNDIKLQPGALAVEFDSRYILQGEIRSAKSESGDQFTEVRSFASSDGGKFNLRQSWTLLTDYTIDYQIDVENLTDRELSFDMLKVSAGDLPAWGKLSGDKMRSDTLGVEYFTESGVLEKIGGDVKDSKFVLAPGTEARWAALTNKYFALILKGENPFQVEIKRLKLDGKDSYLCTAAAVYPQFKVGAKGKSSLRFQYYSGPKEPGLLKAFDPDCSGLLYLAWGPLNYLAKWLLWALVALKGICGSYGWSIIILTMIVRLLFWPVTQKANDSMKKMQTVQPQIKALRDKYKDNPQLLNTKMMELYRSEKINPLGGCLPILLQIPVFFALYATLDGALELRQVAFWWSPDLAGPDTVFSFPLPFSLFGIGNFNLNPLVIAMTLLMVVQQRLTPSSLDPMQQKMMTLMPIVMLIFLYELPSGLTLYWTVSQIFSILQLVLQQKWKKKPAGN